MLKKAGRPRGMRLCDVATSLYFYLMVVGQAGPHAYEAIGKDPKYQLPPLDAVLREARAQVQRYQARLAAAPASADGELPTELHERRQASLRQLDAVEKALNANPGDAGRWDGAVHAAESSRRFGEELSKAAAPDAQRRGLEVAVRAAQVQARVAALIASNKGLRRWDPVKSPIFQTPK